MKIRNTCHALITALIFFPLGAIAAENKLSEGEINKLVEPIALYPDPLLQQILPAATFPDQIADAALLIRSKADAPLIKEQTWDESVKVIATYSGILKMMYQKLDWTTELGNAFLDQPEPVLKQIQALRGKAQDQGNLDSNQHQRVVTSSNEIGDTIIKIEPKDPQVIYVPQETTTVVYTEPVNDNSDVLVPLASFGIGMALGAAMNDDDDDHYYYGGGYYGGSMWSDDWADTRRARNEDMHDRMMDRQDFKQGQKEDRQDFRQDWAQNNPDKINQANLDKAKQRQTDYQANRQQKLSDARASMNSKSSTGFEGFKGTRYEPRQVASGWSGSGSGSYADRASNRGSYSRSSMGSGSYSRGSYSGGSFGSRGGGARMGGGGRGGRGR